MDALIDDLLTWAPLLLRGIWITILVSVLTMTFATVLGAGVALLRIAPFTNTPILGRVVHGLMRGYVDLMRGIPLVVLLFILFYALPSVHVTISRDPLVVGILGFTLNVTAYLSEVWRAAIRSIDPGQMEAALSIGMSPRRAYQRIILPQAGLIATPTLGGYLISTLKDSSLLGFVSVMDLMRTGILLVSTTFKAFEIYFTIGFLYLALSLVASFFVVRVERRLTPAYMRVRSDRDILGGPREVAVLEGPPTVNDPLRDSKR
jgi:His/Glu/Gln/Arg/opine family amino acid ABC transporter permease subunit